VKAWPLGKSLAQSTQAIMCKPWESPLAIERDEYALIHYFLPQLADVDKGWISHFTGGKINLRLPSRGFIAVKVILFSKDRPFQLHATLNSFYENCTDMEGVSIAILYCASSDRFEQAYQELRHRDFTSPTLTWIKEQEFKQDLLGILRGPIPAMNSSRRWGGLKRGRSTHAANDVVLFLVDDTIFVRPFSLARMTQFLCAFPKVLAFSLRLGRNTKSCYSRNCLQRLPEFHPIDHECLLFRWVGQEGDFGYPLELSSSLYRVQDIIPFLMGLPYANPNRLEQRLSILSRLFTRRKPDLLCFDRSVAFCAPINKVQSILDNRAGGQEQYSSESLNDMFMQGVRIDVDQLHDFVPNAAHQEIELPLLYPAANS
jgi:hypothetical protein